MADVPLQADAAFQLVAVEFSNLRSQFATSSPQPTEPVAKNENWSQFATSSSRHRSAVYRPWAFTEHHALMAANVLRSERAVHMSIFVIRAFVRLREQIAANAANEVWKPASLSSLSHTAPL